MEKLTGYKYNTDIFTSAFIAEVDGKKCVLSTTFEKGDAVVRFVDRPVNSYWKHGTVGSTMDNGDTLIFRDCISCGNTRTELWYKIITIIE